MSVVTILANYRDEDPRDCSVELYKGYTFINTPSHGYLVLGSDDNGYSDGIAIARASNYSYILDGGLVYLEEDCDAQRAELRKSSEKESLYSVASVEEIADWSKKSSANRAMEREKAQGNLKSLAKLTVQHDKLKAEIAAYNDGISYLLSDELRIK